MLSSLLQYPNNHEKSFSISVGIKTLKLPSLILFGQVLGVSMGHELNKFLWELLLCSKIDFDSLFCTHPTLCMTLLYVGSKLILDF